MRKTLLPGGQYLVNYITGHGHAHGLRLGFLSYTEIDGGDPSPSLCNVNMYVVQCSRRARNPSP